MEAAEQQLKDQATTGKLISNFQKNTQKLGEANLTFDSLSARLTTLESYWKIYFERHLQIARKEEELVEESYFVNDEFSAVERHYTQTKSFITQRLAALAARALDNAVEPNQAAGVPALQLSTTATSLPKLTLPRFSGKQSEWDSFKALFTSMVKDAPTLTPTLKLQHLLACVEGDALRTIKNIEVTGDNFEVAWTALARRYENKKLRISLYMKRLLYMQPATKKSVAEFTRLLDTTNECRRGLRALGEPINHWDRWFVSIIVFNLDVHTRELWEQHLPADDVPPTYDQLVKFLESKIQALDTAHCPDPEGHPRLAKGVKNSNQNSSRSVSAHHVSNPEASHRKITRCTLCAAEHRLGSCPDFIGYNVDQRWKYVRDSNLCFNCLSKTHKSADCSSSFRCQVCKQAHHTKLHRTTSKLECASATETAAETVSDVSHSVSTHAATLFGTTLLGTARVIAVNTRGEKLTVRALIDPGSEGSFVTERVVQTLAIPKKSMSLAVTGVGGYVSASVKTVATLTLMPRIPTKTSVSVSAAVLPKLSSIIPKRQINRAHWPHLTGLELADPDYHTPAPVDCLIGADLYPEIIRAGLRKGPAGSPVAHHTIFGWILAGPTELQEPQQGDIDSFNLSITPIESLGSELRKFWELEELPNFYPLTPDEKQCEEHFCSTHQRDESGRFVVRLPFKSEPHLPGSHAIARQSFLALERRLCKDASLRQSYSRFMQDYECLGHMKKTPNAQASQETAYLPHHAVVGKKLRVVFNASRRASNAKSLNDFLLTGAKLQQDISTILLRWRFGRFAFMADIIKMFRQIRVHEEDIRWQRIFWRTDPGQHLQEYDLTTVTYGTASAPFLSLRVLRQLAEDEYHQHPAGSAILRENMYMDDALVSCDTEEEAIEARTSLVNILRSAGMELDKWASNCPSVLPQDRSELISDRTFDKDLNVPTLGLRWTPSTDLFCYSVPEAAVSTTITKRSILSEVARVFDPTGWISPVTVRAKMLLQYLWLQGQDWDSLADATTTRAWLDFRQQLPELQTLQVPRWIGITKSDTYSFHGFSDASERAYAAVIYLVSADNAHLLAAKSKVAPIRTVSLPRLELCGATLLSRLMAKVLQDLSTPNSQLYCWTDSQVVLAWLRAPPCTWKVFIANRVSEIHSLLPNAAWNHVVSKQNPADIASRGCTPSQLKNDDLWWHGPAWMLSSKDFPSQDGQNLSTQLEKRAERSVFATTQEETIETLINRFSSLNRLYRVIAYCLRWNQHVFPTVGKPRDTAIRADEVVAARISIIRAVQATHFSVEIIALTNKRTIPKGSSLLRHKPFLDEQRLLRVGGRLEHSMLSFQEKHPIIIPKTSRLTELLILEAHRVTLHGGPQLVQSYLLRRWWIIQGRNKIRQMIRACVTCTRYQGQRQEQIMAPLPASRVTPARPFTETGLDYAGPFALRTSKGRGQKSFKGYVAVFTCLSSRAVHLEVVSDYTSKTFLLALRRFFARRGLSRRILTDCGTTFQGAASELQELFRAASAFSKEVAATLAQDEITWDFIPPRAPHFGGLWEAAVKSFKSHLKRVIGDAKLTFEEFSTLAAQIEACLNSRPLCPISADPQDFAALTPGHFLTGSALLAAPEPFSEEKLEGLPRWKVTTQMRNHFWRRWYKEVLNHMQLRQKWMTEKPGLTLGDLVLLTDDLQAPQRWPLARVEQIHPGSDGLTRVVTLRTPTTTLKRPITKLIRLPVNDSSIPSASSSAVLHGGQPR